MLAFGLRKARSQWVEAPANARTERAWVALGVVFGLPRSTGRRSSRRSLPGSGAASGERPRARRPRAHRAARRSAPQLGDPGECASSTTIVKWLRESLLRTRPSDPLGGDDNVRIFFDTLIDGANGARYRRAERGPMPLSDLRIGAALASPSKLRAALVSRWRSRCSCRAPTSRSLEPPPVPWPFALPGSSVSPAFGLRRRGARSHSNPVFASPQGAECLFGGARVASDGRLTICRERIRHRWSRWRSAVANRRSVPTIA